MTRYTNLITGMAMAAVLVGCGGTTTTSTDMAKAGAGDMAMTGNVPDLAMPIGPVGAPTGDPCNANGDCAKSVAGTSTAPICTKNGLTPQVPYPGGYCQSPCRPSKTDMSTGLNSDCPSDSAACQLTSQTAGKCVKICMSADTDCRQGYICENNTSYAASCSPKATNWCDPKMAMSCPKAADGASQLCTDFSPDQSAGQCTEICDVFNQAKCPQPMQGMNACIANPMSGVATCLNTGSGMDGQQCIYLNECAPGLACTGAGGARACRSYCRTAGDAGAAVACPMGQTCKDLSMTIKSSQIGICG